MWRMLGHILYSIRPSACLMVALLVLAAYRPGANELMEAIWLFACAFAGSAYCFVLNDILDREKDLLNEKRRPIATGELPLRLAWMSGLICLLIYLSSALILGWLVLALAAFSIVLFSFYSPINNHLGLLANVIVAFCAAGALWGVAIIKAFDNQLLFFSVILFFMVLAREIFLDCLDVYGDKQIGKTSLPGVLGLSKSILVAGLVLLVAFVLVVFSINEDLTTLSKTLLFLTIPAIAIPYVKLLWNQSRDSILLNVRWSHLSFVLFVLAVIFR